ncbi:hypothetical protein E2320_002024 [Naja naja]|nr:hypothetical protein E2320_002024 [Naja naja]
MHFSVQETLIISPRETLRLQRRKKALSRWEAALNAAREGGQLGGAGRREERRLKLFPSHLAREEWLEVAGIIAALPHSD